jgi:hypothetical protein
MEYVPAINKWVPEPNIWKFLKGGNVVDEEDICYYPFDADVCSAVFISGWLWRAEETGRAPQSSGTSTSASTGTSSWDASACTGTCGTSTSSTRIKVTAVLQIL